MRKLLHNNHGNMATVITAIAVAIAIAIGIIITYSVLGSTDTSTIDSNLQSELGWGTGFTPAGNATTSLVTGLGTFFTIAPIYLVVLIAVAIIGAVMGIMIVRRRG